ncbi:MAG: T9SS type A sorting domain-containing protein [Flavobacteriales bacterium]
MIDRYIGLTASALLSLGLHAQQNRPQAALLRSPSTHAHHAAALGGAAPVNDHCDQVVPEALAAGATLTFTGTTTGATVDGDFAPGSQLDGYGPVVWLAFTTSEPLEVTIDYCGSASQFTDYWNLVTTDCPANDLIIAQSYDEITCPDNNPSVYFSEPLPAGTYYYPVWADANTANGPYTIHVTASGGGPAGPVNDRCSGATVTPLAANATATITGDNTGATDSEGLGFNSVWEAFSLSECATVVLDYCATDGFGGYAQGLMSGCPGGTLIAATATTTCENGQQSETFQELAAGTYYIPVLMEEGVSEGSYTLTLTTTACPAPEPPVNDGCGDITAEVLAIDGTLELSGDNTGALASGDAVEGSTLDDGHAYVWHAFTLNDCADVTLDYCGTATPFTHVTNVLAVGCPADSTIAADGLLDSCDDGNAALRFGHLAAGTYYIPVFSDAPDQGSYTIHLSATACAPAPVNDDCATATELNVTPTCEPIRSSLEGATGSLAAIDCRDAGLVSGNKDVWFSFIPTQSAEVVHVQGDGIDAVVEVFQNGCDDLLSIACSDTSLVGGVEELTLTGLSVEETYYVRVYHWSATDPADPAFDICVYGDMGTRVNEVAAQGLALYPNPGNGDLTLSNSGIAGNVTLEALDMTGRRVIAQGAVLVENARYELPWSGKLSPGTYLLRITGAEGMRQQRFTVK